MTKWSQGQQNRSMTLPINVAQTPTGNLVGSPIYASSWQEILINSGLQIAETLITNYVTDVMNDAQTKIKTTIETKAVQTQRKFAGKRRLWVQRNFARRTTNQFRPKKYRRVKSNRAKFSQYRRNKSYF